MMRDGDMTLSYKERLKQCYMVMQDVNHQLFTESVMDELLISMKIQMNNKLLRYWHSLDCLNTQKGIPCPYPVEKNNGLRLPLR